MTVGDRVRQRRIELGLTQDELAKRLGYKGRTSVCVVENGEDNVTTTKVRKFAEALGVTPAYLMGWEEEPKADKGNIMMIGGNARSLPVFAEGDDIEKALELYKAYSDASPDVKSAIEILLKSHLSDA